MQLSYGATLVCLKEVFLAGKTPAQFCISGTMQEPPALWLTLVKLL